MEMTKCPQCGRDVSAEAAFCEGCGSRLTPPTPTYEQPAQTAYQQPPYQQPYQQPYQPPYQPPYQQPVYVVQRPKIPGRGLGIASMVLGIIGTVYSFSLMIEMFTMMNMRFSDEFYSVLLMPLLMIAAFPILALSMGGVARQRGYRNGISAAGVVLGAVSAVFITVGLIVLLANL